MKDHFRFNIRDAKQLAISMMGAFIPWAARGFQHDLATLWYTFGGFITGGLVSHNAMENPNVAPTSHIMTPYVNNINEDGEVKVIAAHDAYKPEGTDIKQVIKVNSGLIK